MNSTTTRFGIQQIQGAFNILATLQLTAHLWPQQAQVKDGVCFDFIIIGAGSAGSVVANRLTEIEDATVLLIEAGGDPPLESVVPGLFLYLKKTSFDWNYVTEDDGYSQQFHRNKGAELIRGKMLGGSSSINFQAYTRGNPHDYDNWAKITGDDSWSWNNVLPYFMKSERLVDLVLLESNSNGFHGTCGYLGTSRNHKVEVLKYFEAFQEIGHDIVLDTNDGTSLGYTENLFTIASGVRQSTAQAFLHPIKGRQNLYVLKNTLVSKILFDDDKNAIGVEAILENNRTIIVHADKEVIVSGGAINTPQLLMLSGIGPKEHLKIQNIDVISDLPVGQALQDHITVIMTHTMGNSTPPKPVDPTTFPTPAIFGYTTLNKSQDYPDYQTYSLLMNEPTAMMQFCTFYYSFVDKICDVLYNSSLGKKVLLTSHVLLYPDSRGKILLRSKDPKEQPLIYNGYYSDYKDLDKHATYIEDFLRVQHTTFFKSVEAKLIIPEVCGCGDFNLTHEYYKCYVLCMMASGYDYAGSCPLGDVVDSHLKVFGVQRLRVADASIMPKIVGTNINAATLMIGEKAADFIKEDYVL